MITSDMYIVNAQTGCWEWSGSRHPYGYGQLSVGGKGLFAHRYAWELANGKIPKGMHICHKCDNPPCVNPEHLFCGTNTENRHDSVRKGRAAHGDTHGLRKLNSERVLLLRKVARENEFTHATLADMFKISQTQVSRIIRGDKWKHLGGAQKATLAPAARGERNVKAKLCAEDVHRIRDILRCGGTSNIDIAKYFYVSAGTISLIKRGRIWTHI